VLDKSEKIFIKNVGQKLREKRLSKHLSQATLSYDANIPINQIGRIERGEINTTIGSLFKICKALDIDFAELLP
jgi:transcriptional regulator with XRE-family HTH domain